MDYMKKIVETRDAYYEIMDTIPAEGAKNVAARNIIGRLATLLEQEVPDIFRKATCLQTDDCVTDGYKICRLNCGEYLLLLQSDEATAVIKTKNVVSSIRVNSDGIKINTSANVSIHLMKNSVSIKLPGTPDYVNYTIPLTVDGIMDKRDVLEYAIKNVMGYISGIRKIERNCVKSLRMTC